MNTIAATPAAPQPLLPAAWRLGAAAAAAILILLVSVSAERASHDAVGTAITTFGTAAHVTLPSVEIIGRRGPAGLRSSRAAQAVS